VFRASGQEILEENMDRYSLSCFENFVKAGQRSCPSQRWEKCRESSKMHEDISTTYVNTCMFCQKIAWLGKDEK